MLSDARAHPLELLQLVKIAAYLLLLQARLQRVPEHLVLGHGGGSRVAPGRLGHLLEALLGAYALRPLGQLEGSHRAVDTVDHGTDGC